MNCYIVRIYRRDADNPDALVGVVEEVEKQIKHSFTCLDDLWAILVHRKKSQEQAVQGYVPGNRSTEQRVNGGKEAVMKKRRNSILVICLVLSLGLSLVSCGGGGGTAANTTTNSTWDGAVWDTSSWAP
jgi:hypothetical protein